MLIQIRILEGGLHWALRRTAGGGEKNLHQPLAPVHVWHAAAGWPMASSVAAGKKGHPTVGQCKVMASAKRSTPQQQLHSELNRRLT